MEAVPGPHSNKVLRYLLPARARVVANKNVGVCDRIASGILATTGALIATRQRGVIRFALGLISLAIGRKAITGYSHLYRTLDIHTAGLSRQHLSKAYDDQIEGGLGPLPYVIKRSVTLNRPRIDVYASFKKPERVLDQLPGLHDIHHSGKDLHFWYTPDAGEAGRVRFTIDHEAENHYVIWRCHVDGAHIASGVLSFADAPGDGETEIVIAFDLINSALDYRSLGGIRQTHLKSADRLTLRYLRFVRQLLETGHLVGHARSVTPHIHVPPLGAPVERRDRLAVPAET